MAVALAEVWLLPERVRMHGDPDSMTCHLCRGRPVAICVRCHTCVCGEHRCLCGHARYVAPGTPGWKNEADRRYRAWKGAHT